MIVAKVLISKGIYVIKIAIKTLGLDELSPFKPQERVIEYMLEDSLEQSCKSSFG